MKSKEVILSADKTSNLYKMSVEEHNKEMLENVTKQYKKCVSEQVEKGAKEAANIKRQYELEDKVDIPPPPD